MYAYTVLTMVDLVLNRRLNTRNILLAQGPTSPARTR